MIKGFKEFIMRGSVVELATAVIIGAAFTAIVTAFTDKIIGPLLAAIPTGSDCGQTMSVGEDTTQAAAVQVCGLSYQLLDDDAATRMDFGAVIAAGINFLIVATVVYFLIIVPYNKLNEMAALRRGDTGEPEEDTEIDILTQIRDLLAQPPAQAAPTPQTYSAPPQGYTAPPQGYSGGLPNPAPQYPTDGPGRHSR
ncbi:large-conductance mechanosensitive channel [Gordonia hirsuta DSM 44140 = NBRC 16056]|uniref:Large-conductance mechanosensitive channel n=1 Tax=Gordonia hirsuta DSM 44140 = NBRC 16056 TaxID=1121927 RepID=L7L9Q0_9ACTN|nr:large conductance mechanosensitive channel protein MscL [Gordonia hirsuta]GAC57456.1 large-conductance mechanosensitive channel [Gordonia hirsuta DSM 44140 = NBRC 16056]